MINENVNNSKTKEPRSLVGRVVSDKMDKTIVVRVERTYIDKRFNKIMRVAKKYKAHDENQEASIGDMVEIHECRPLSKEKYMRLFKILTAVTRG